MRISDWSSDVCSSDLTQQLATASADKTIKLWDTNTWTMTHHLTAHQRWVWDCAFSGDSNYLVSASSDQTAKLWHTGTGEVVRNYTGHSLSVTCAAINDSRSEERRVGKEWVSTSRYGGSQNKK